MTIIYGAAGTDGKRLAWPLLTYAVREFWGWDGLPPVERSSRGKPLFTGRNGHWFSLSHSGGMALCALSTAPVGVDIELIRPRRTGLPTYALSADELTRFDGSWEDFYRLWTLKESWCKQGDTPLFPPRGVPAPPPCPHRSYAGEGWQAAVCCFSPPPHDIIWVKPGQLALTCGS